MGEKRGKQIQGKKQNTLLARISDGYLTAMLTVFLFFAGPGGYLSIDQDKFYCFLVITVAYLALLLLASAEYWVLHRKLPVGRDVLAQRFSPVQGLFLAYLLFTGISALLSPYGSQTWMGMSRNEGVLTIGLYVLGAVALSFFACPRHWHLGLFGVSVTGLCVLSLVQMAGYNPFGLYPEGYDYYDANVRYAGVFLSTIGNIDFLGAILAAAAPACLAGLLRLSGRRKWLLLCPLVLSLLVLALAQLDGGMLGSLITMLFVPAVVLPAQRVRRIWALAAGGCLIAGLVIVWLVPFSNPTLSQLHQLLHGQIEDSFGSGRIGIWRKVLALVPEHLWFGTGPDTLIAAGLPPFTRVSETWGLMEAQIDTAHNEFLNILVQQGLLALLAYSAAVVLLLRRWLCQARSSSAVAICGAGLIGYTIQSLFGISACFSAPVFWGLAGLMLAAAIQREKI